MYANLNNRLSAQASPMATAATRFIDELSMDVLVKSFNRAYCLDRCLASLRHHVRKIRSIRVLDDGTPEKYLDEIKRRHPHIEILRSPRHAENAARIEAYRASDPSPPSPPPDPPWSFWRESVQSASPRFLLLADDQWCVRDLDLGGVSQIMKARDCALVRLFKNPALDHGPATPLSPELCQIHPWYLKSRLHILIYQTLLARFLQTGSPWANQAQALSVHSGIFDRSFWLDVTEIAPFIPSRALRWAFRHRHAAFARTTSNFVTTTTRCSSSFSSNLDMLLFNQLLNESWLAGRFDPYAGLPGDFPDENILAILAAAGEPSCTPEKWSLWRDQYSENQGGRETTEP